MSVEIVNRYTAAVLYTSETAETVAQAVAEAVSRGANLRRANLGGANLRHADLGGADLGGAYLGGADLRGAYLYGANLRGAYLYGANLGGANLYGADLSCANLGGADLSCANLGGADLGGAYLYGAYLYGAYLYGAYLRGAYLYGANLGGANGLLSNGTIPLQILGTRDAVIVRQDGYITIGCEHHELIWWEEHYRAIGRTNRYSDAETEEYRAHIAHCRAWMEAHGVVDVIPGQPVQEAAS